MATQKDIANKLGVSVSLVSRALSGKAAEIGVTEKTVQRIHAAAEKMGYVPSAAARVLKGASSQTIGVVVFDFEDPFFGPIIGELQRLAHAKAYSLVLVGFERRHVDRNDLEPLIRHNLDGLIVVGSEPVVSWLEPFRNRDIPIVRIGSGPSKEPVHIVGVDQEKGIREGLSYLQEFGHKKVGFVGATLRVHQYRYEIFQQCVTDLGLVHDSDWVALHSDSAVDAGEGACNMLLEKCGMKLPTALMASSDLVALGVIKNLQANSINVPVDMSVLGFDDMPLARLMTPALTTIRQPVPIMAKKAFEWICRGREANEGAEIDSMLPLELIIRDSVSVSGKGVLL